MRTILSLLILFGMSMAVAATPQSKSNLRILYVGGSADYEQRSFTNEEDFRQSVKKRMASFEQFLHQYFTAVTVITADKYTQQMSDNYDVTVMDGTPKELVPEFLDMQRRVYKKAGYLTEDFCQPMLTIGELSSVLGNRIGCKNDWYCLCLGGDAHSWRKDHPIFKGPFPVKMTVVNKPTPEEAFHYAYEQEDGIPKELPMWQVQTRDYTTEQNFRIGMISRSDDYEDGIETEYISGGVSSKSLSGVAIGRHANFFHWGFAASPAYMTDEAKNVFANAIVYISRFKGQRPIIRKYVETISTRATLKSLQHLSSLKGYEEMVELNNKANELIAAITQKAKEKQAKDEPLTEEEKMYLHMQPIPTKSREEILGQLVPNYFALFGTDNRAYETFFQENRPYFYGGDGSLEMAVDQDAKSLGIPNNDLRLIDAAIKMLESGKDAARGRRLLARYTLADFPTAAEWRAWFEKNKKKLFFSEAGGWVFLINSREPGVNDYRGKEIRDMQARIQPEMTQDNQPVTLVASKETLQSGEQMVFIKVKIHPGYHLYAQVDGSSPFIPTRLDIQLPEGYAKAGDMVYPASKPFNQKGTTAYEDTIVFRQPITGQGKGTITCKISYQCCNNNICFPPTEEILPIQVN